MTRIRKFLVAGLLLLLLTTEAGCFWEQPGNQLIDKPNPRNESLSEARVPPTDTAPTDIQLANTEQVTVTLAAVGDVMGHTPELKAAWNAKRKSYDFTPMLAPVRNQVSEADVAVVNLETPLAGPKVGYSGFPRFNSPDALAQALKNTGFDVVTTANNHSMDKGTTGLLRTLSALDKLRLEHTGTSQSVEARQKPLIKEVKGIKIGFVGYTYGTNGLLPPKGKSYLLNYAVPQVMLRDLKNLKQQGAEVNVVLLHFGNEYQRQPTPAQEKLVDDLIAGGADVILGSHPHVLQPVQMRQVVREGKTSSGLVAFSLGNFLSNQSQPYTDTGMVLEVRLTRASPGSPVKISGITLTPTWVAKYSLGGKSYFEVQPLQTLLSGGDKPYLTASRRKSLNEALTNTTSHLTSRLQDGSIPVTAPGMPLQ